MCRVDAAESSNCRGEGVRIGDRGGVAYHHPLCVVESLALLSHSTRNRTPAPAYRFSSVSLIYLANLDSTFLHSKELNTKHFELFRSTANDFDRACRFLIDFQLRHLLCTYVLFC
jgi:hypothetical protein